MPEKERRSIFNDMNLAEWRASMVRRDSSDYAMPGTAASADPESPPQLAFHGCKVRMGADKTIANGANDVISWTVDVFDTDNLHGTTSLPGRFTVPTGLAGFWRMTCRMVDETGNAHNNRMEVQFRRNSQETITLGDALQTFRTIHHSITGNQMHYPMVDVFEMRPGDYINIFVDALDEQVVIQSGGAARSFAIFEYVGPTANANTE